MKFFSKFIFFLAVFSFVFAEEDTCDHWGYHLILDCRGCDIEAITSRDVLSRFIKELVKEIDMIAYGEPLIEYFAEHNPEAAGYSLVQLIQTSSITGHFVDKNGDAYIDIFSCKEFSIEKAKGIIETYFRPKKVRVTFIHRQA